MVLFGMLWFAVMVHSIFYPTTHSPQKGSNAAGRFGERRSPAWSGAGRKRILNPYVWWQWYWFFFCRPKCCDLSESSLLQYPGGTSPLAHVCGRPWLLRPAHSLIHSITSRYLPGFYTGKFMLLVTWAQCVITLTKPVTKKCLDWESNSYRCVTKL